MNQTLEHHFNPALDLVLERTVDIAREDVWQAWTDPEQLKQWFTPKPWTTAHCEIDLRPGGIFRTVMRGPEGEEFDGSGCYLEVVPNEKLVWTSALLPGFRPQDPDKLNASGGFPFTAVITMEPHPVGTRYKVVLIHGSQAHKEQHGDMGFESGWGTAFDQLVEMVKAKTEK